MKIEVGWRRDVFQGVAAQKLLLRSLRIRFDAASPISSSSDRLSLGVGSSFSPASGRERSYDEFIFLFVFCCSFFCCLACPLSLLAVTHRFSPLPSRLSPLPRRSLLLLPVSRLSSLSKRNKSSPSSNPHRDCSRRRISSSGIAGSAKSLYFPRLSDVCFTDFASVCCFFHLDSLYSYVLCWQLSRLGVIPYCSMQPFSRSHSRSWKFDVSLSVSFYPQRLTLRVQHPSSSDPCSQPPPPTPPHFHLSSL